MGRRGPFLISGGHTLIPLSSVLSATPLILELRNSGGRERENILAAERHWPRKSMRGKVVAPSATAAYTTRTSLLVPSPSPAGWYLRTCETRPHITDTHRSRWRWGTWSDVCRRRHPSLAAVRYALAFPAEYLCVAMRAAVPSS